MPGLLIAPVARSEILARIQKTFAQPAAASNTSLLSTKRADVSHDTAVIAAINLLPLEILCEIFFYVSFSDLDPFFAPCLLPDTRAGPLLLSRVCSYWRKLAIGTPLLWAAIHLHHKPGSPMVKLWIDRSQDLPFSFFWDFQNHTRPVYLGYRWVETVLSLLASCMHRWSSIAFNRINEKTAKLILGLSIPLSLPIRELLLTSNIYDPSLNSEIWQSIPTSNLRRFRYYSPHYRPLFSDWSFWSTLTTIQIGHHVNLQDAIALLIHAVNAAEIYLATISNAEAYAVPVGKCPIILPSMKSFSVALGSVDLTLLLDHFSAPHLKILRLSGLNYDIHSPRRLATFLERSSCPIQEVTLLDMNIGVLAIDFLSVSAFHTIPVFLIHPGTLKKEEHNEVKEALQKLDVVSNHYIEEETRFVDPVWGWRWYGWSNSPRLFRHDVNTFS